MSRIAVFDSGMGGIGVLDAIRARAPWADIIYLADHAFGPYGERTLDEVRDRTTLIARFLQSAGADMIVVACNSASAAALHHLRAAIGEVAFVGMEPAVKPAAERTKTGTIAVLATDATFQGELFRSLTGRFAGDIEIIEQACPGLALAIERGDPVDALLDRYVSPLGDTGADVVVLGCTHYPHIIDRIAACLPDSVELIDPAPAVAARVTDVAHEHRIDLRGSGWCGMWTTSLDTVRPDGRDWETVDIPPEAASAASCNDATLVAVQGDITVMPVTAIVNAANPGLMHGGGVALAIARAGGATIDDESAAWAAAHGPLTTGTAALTSAGKMPSSYVIHVAGPIHTPGQDNERLLAAAVNGALDAAIEIEAATVAMPAISAGIYGYPPDEACAVIVSTVARRLRDDPGPLRSVRLVGFDRVMADRFGDLVRRIGAAS
ncbi:MAG: glutamate racemase [Acidimicrobiia bacterium]